MKRILAFLVIALSYKGVVQSQQKYKIYGGNECTFEYLVYSPEGNVDKTKPKIIQLGEHKKDIYECFENDSLRKLTEFKEYIFYYIPNTRQTNSERLQCLKLVRNQATFSTNLADKKVLERNLFLFVNDQSISKADIKASNLEPEFSNIILASDIKKNTVDNSISNLDYNAVLQAFRKKEEGEKNQVNYTGPPQNFNFTLSGIIKDSETGESLPFATIQVNGTSNGTTTNMDGYFTLHNVPTDTSTLLTSYIGYKRAKLKLNPSNSKSGLIIEIEPTSQTLEEVVVTAEREDILQVASENISTIKMTPKKLDQLPNLGEQDIMRSFQLMPGISASNESSSGMYVRGGTPDQNLIVYDGFTIYHVDHLYGFYSAFNSNAIKDVQLYKGGFESRFGGRLSSVTEITGKDGNQNNFNIGASLSLLNVNAYAEVPIGEKFTSIFAFRRSYKGPIYNTIFDQFNEDNNTTTSQLEDRFATSVSSYFYDLNGKFTFKPTDKDIISLSIFNGTDDLDNGYQLNTPQRLLDMGIDFNLDISDLTNYGNFATGIKWSRRWTPKLYGNTVISYSNYYSDREVGRDGTVTNQDESQDITGGFIEDNNLKDYSVKSDYQWDLSQLAQIKYGVFGTSYDIKYDYIQNDTVTVINKKDKGLIVGGYLQTHFKLWDDKLKLVPGLRLTSYDVTNKIYWEPRISANYSFSEKLKLKLAWGKYYQFANRITREDISSGSKDFWALSNGEDIAVSSSLHYVAGLSYETSKYLFSLEGYYKDLNGLSEYSQRFESSLDGINYEENFFSGIGYSKGLEFLVQKKAGRLNGWISYTLGEAKNKFNIYGEKYFSASQDVTHEIKWVGIFNYKRWDFSATWVYATGRPYTAPSGAYSITLPDGSMQNYYTVTAKNSLRLPEYHRLDIALNYKLYGKFKGESKKREIGHLGFSIFNLYDRTNTWYNQYEIIEGEIIETNINYLGIMPNVTLSLKLR